MRKKKNTFTYLFVDETIAEKLSFHKHFKKKKKTAHSNVCDNWRVLSQAWLITNKDDIRPSATHIPSSQWSVWGDKASDCRIIQVTAERLTPLDHVTVLLIACKQVLTWVRFNVYDMHKMGWKCLRTTEPVNSQYLLLKSVPPFQAICGNQACGVTNPVFIRTTPPPPVSHFQFHLLPPLCDFHLISLLKFKIYSRFFFLFLFLVSCCSHEAPIYVRARFGIANEECACDFLGGGC